MNKDFQDAIELRLRQNFGPSKFATFMVRNIAQWEAISLKQLLEIIEIFKYDAPIYALFPFVYYYLDIDIYGMYSKLADEHNWDPEKVKRQIDSFSTHIVLASDKSTKMDTPPVPLPRVKVLILY